VNDSLRERIALLETSQSIDAEAYARVEASLGSLQAELAAKEEELRFYRGIVSPEDGAPGLKVQRFEVLPTDADARRYQMRLLLVQAIRQDRRVTGVVRVRFEGLQNGAPSTLGLDALDAGGDGRLAFSFRYFQDFERELELPEGFEPSSMEVEIVPSGRGMKPVTQAYEWPAAAG
jgi:hypothetical protein